MQSEMHGKGWQFFISRRHVRLARLWQSFFAGWGLFFTVILVISPFIFKNLVPSLSDFIDINSIEENNLSIGDLKIRGTDKNGELFSVSAESAIQKFSEPDIIYFTKPIADIVKLENGNKVKQHIVSDLGNFDSKQKKIMLFGSVKIKSSEGKTIYAEKMEIDLK